MDKLGDMDLFVRVVKNSGLAAAGREVGLSPASMSARMNALEARYNTRLLNRNTRHVSVTETGQQFYEASLRLLADFIEIESQILGNQELLTGSLRITAPSDIGQLHIMPVLSKFIDDNPEITPYLHLTDGIVNIMEEGYDCAIRYGSLPDSSLIARKLTTNHRVLCASPEYLIRNGSPKTLQDLSEHDCLTMTRDTEPLSTWFFTNDNGIESVIIKAARSSNDGALVKRWAVEGAGIALKSYLEVVDEINSGRLVVVLEEFMPDFNRKKSNKNKAIDLTHSADLHVVYPSRQYLPRRVTTFVEYLLKYFDALKKSK